MTISFNSNGGSGTMESFTYMPESIYTLPECRFSPPTGKTFHGWLITAAGTGAEDPVTGDLTLTGDGEAQLAYEVFTVTFYDGFGGTLKTETVKKGNSATPPADPKRDGYTFKGWDTDFSKVTSDLTVRAKWKQMTHKVTFEDGMGTVLKTQIVVDGRSATAPEDPARDGFIFSGWDADFSCVKKDLTVKARWTEKSHEEDKYTVVFVIGFGHDPVSMEVTEGGSATAPSVPEVDGFTFTEWDKEFTNVTENLTVTAKWKKKYSRK